MIDWAYQYILIQLQVMIFAKEKTLSSQVKALNKGEPADAELIWRSLEGNKAQDDIQYFCFQLFDNITHSEKKNYLLQNQERIYATFLFMELYKNKKKKKPQLLLQCQQFIQKMQPSLGKTYLHYIYSSQHEKHYGQFFMSRLVSAPEQINWQQNIHIQFQGQLQQCDEYLKSRHKTSQSQRNHEFLKYQSYPLFRFPQTKMLTFGYILFVDYLKKNGHSFRKSDHQHLNNMIRYLVNAAEKNSVVEELLPLAMHLLMKIIVFYGCEEEGLKEYLVWAERLRCFTGLVGKMGAQMFDLLYQELLMPGTAFRKKLRKDFPSLSIKQNTFINKQFFLITDQQQIYNRPEDVSLITLRKLFIVQTIKTSKIDETNQKLYVQFLKKTNQQQTFILYDKLTKILDTVAKLDSKNKIQALLSEYIVKLMNQTMLRVSKQNEGQKQQTDKNKKNKMESQEFVSFINRGNKMGYFPYPNFQIISVPISDFVSNKESAYNFQRILQKNKTDFQNSGFFKNKIAIAFLGNGYSLQKLVQVISKYLQQTNLQDSKQIQLFYLPKHDNISRPGVGRYLSRKDAWYRKFIFNIHFQKTLYPHIDLNQNTKDLFPFYLYSKNLQLYLQQATNSLPLRIYRCKLKMAEQDQEQTIYMFSYFSMGIFCEARIIKMQKQKQRSKEEKEYSKQLTEIIHQKLKKFQPMNVSLEVEVVDNLSGTIMHKKEKCLAIQDLQICNLPSQYFMGKEPNPASPLLQMTILTTTNAKIFKKQIDNSDNFKENKNFDEVHQAFKQLFLCRTIKSITIENLDKNNSLRIMVDGNFANKIERIKIQPAVSVSGIPISLQIQCFLPV